MRAGAAPTMRGILRKRRNFGAIVLNASCLEHEDVCSRAENAIAQLALQPRHHRQRDDEREHADGDAERGDNEMIEMNA